MLDPQMKDENILMVDESGRHRKPQECIGNYR